MLGTLATALAGGGAAGGKPVMDALGGWRFICTIVAVLTAVGTVAGALHKSFGVSDKLSSSVACIGKLRSLELSLMLSKKDPVEAAQLYEQILKEHPDCI